MAPQGAARSRCSSPTLVHQQEPRGTKPEHSGDRPGGCSCLCLSGQLLLTPLSSPVLDSTHCGSWMSEAARAPNEAKTGNGGREGFLV